LAIDWLALNEDRAQKDAERLTMWELRAAVRGWDKLLEGGIELESGEEVVHERERSQAFAAQLKRAGVWHDSFESSSCQGLCLAIL
jgi:hypothetical protein